MLPPPAVPAIPAPVHDVRPITDDRGDRKRPDRAILVIEDDLNFAYILYDLAHELDFDCLHAANATKGVELA